MSNNRSLNINIESKLVMPLVATAMLGICGFTMYHMFRNFQQKVRNARKQLILHLNLNPVPAIARPSFELD
jgi:hypothetical protein